MKTSGILLAALGALSLTACSKEGDGTAAAGAQELRLRSGIEAVTRGSVQSTAIVADETVYAWVADAVTGDDLYNALVLKAQADGALSGTTPMYFPKTGNGVNVAALHGQLRMVMSLTTAMPESLAFTVADDQSEGGGTNYVHSDLLYAAQTVPRTKEPVKLTFYHMLSKLELKITKGAGVTDEITAATLDDVALGGTFTPNTTGDLTNQSVRAAMIAVNATNTGSMSLGAALADVAGTTNDAIVVPQQIDGKTLTFTLASGGELVYTIPAGKTFESGKKHIYEVTLKLTGLEVTSTIEDWGDGGTTGGEATMPEPVPAKIGDYFYSDGSYSSKLAEEGGGKTVIGIVFQTDPARIGAAEKDALKAKGVSAPHGLVMAVKNAATGAVWSTRTEDTGAMVCTTVAACYDDISGLKNTQAVYALESYKTDPTTYPAFKAVADFSGSNTVPTNATEWFMPSAGQLWDILENLGSVDVLKGQRTNESSDWDGTDTGNDICASLNERLTGVAGADKFDDSLNYFWSSSENSSNRARYWDVYSGGYVRCHWVYKSNGVDVRPVLAF